MQPDGPVPTPLAGAEHARVPDSSPHGRLTLPGGAGGAAYDFTASVGVCENGVGAPGGHHGPTREVDWFIHAPAEKSEGSKKTKVVVQLDVAQRIPSGETNRSPGGHVETQMVM